MFVLMIVLAVFSAKLNSLSLAFGASLLYTWIVITGHNYLHQRDNFRMIYFNLSFMSYRDWRISHALSHHMYPNSLHDVEVMLFEPILCWIPSEKVKNSVQRYVSWIYSFALYFLLYIAEFLKK